MQKDIQRWGQYQTSGISKRLKEYTKLSTDTVYSSQGVYYVPFTPLALSLGLIAAPGVPVSKRLLLCYKARVCVWNTGVFLCLQQISHIKQIYTHLLKRKIVSLCWCLYVVRCVCVWACVSLGKCVWVFKCQRMRGSKLCLSPRELCWVWLNAGSLPGQRFSGAGGWTQATLSTELLQISRLP